jgi:site-specific DNA-methyltransferase (adenine-specific)
MIELICGDCLVELPKLAAQSVDMIATDLPYGSIACTWDTIIPFTPMWREIARVLKPQGVFITTASQPFASALIMSNPKSFKHEWIWEKSKATGHANCHHQPMRAHESVLVFCNGSPTYNPQKEPGAPYKQPRKNPKYDEKINAAFKTGINVEDNTEGGRYPRSIIRIKNAYYTDGGQLHPTQKPVALYEYLIHTYTNAGNTVLDFCMGSGTTGVACVNTGRNFMGIEREPKYAAIAQRRISEAQQQPKLEGCIP